MLGWTSTIALLLIALLFDFRNELVPVAFSAAHQRSSRPIMRCASDMTWQRAPRSASWPPSSRRCCCYMLQGHPWQMEAHMFFFVGLAALTLVCDWRPIAVAVGLIAVHHLLFSYFAPEWVFFGSGEFLRVMFHALAVSMVLGRARPDDGPHGQAVRRAVRGPRRPARGLAASAQRGAGAGQRLRSRRSRRSARSGWRWSAAAWPTRGGTS